MSGLEDWIGEQFPLTTPTRKEVEENINKLIEESKNPRGPITYYVSRDMWNWMLSEIAGKRRFTENPIDV